VPSARAQSLVLQADASFDADLSCPTLEVEFAQPLELLVESGSRSGTRLDLVLRPAEDAEFDPAAPEFVPAPTSDRLGATSISLTQSGADLVLAITFAREVVADATISPDGTLLSVAVADADDPGPCLRNLTADDDDAPDADSTAAAPGEAGEDAADVEQDFTDARAAITAENYDRAIALLTRILAAPENARSAEAQELLGVVRERNEQFAQARAEYEAYLEKYPDGEGAVRVRQRLNALVTAQAAPPEPLREAAPAALADVTEEREPEAPAEPAAEAEAPPAPVAVADAAPPPPPAVDESEEEEEEEELPKLDYTGSFDATYFFRQGTTRFEEFDTARRSVDDIVFQNSLVNTLSFRGSYETLDYLLSWRVAGAYEFDFEDDDSGELRFSRLWIDYDSKASPFSYRFGRHVVRSGGVFDRFDGLTVSWEARENTELHFQLGSPVDSVRDGLFEFDRLTYGASVDFNEIRPNTDLTLYVTEQRVEGTTDRRSVGFEVDYEGEQYIANAAVDYDIYFARLNYARISGTRIFDDRSTVTLSFDFVQSPTLALSNAEQGQGGRRIDELLGIFTLDELKQFALDRTTATRSATLAYNRPLDEKWLLNLDATVFDTESNPASGGVAAIPAPGLDYYASVGVFGSGIFSETDVISASLRYANTSSSTLWLADGSYRFEPAERWRLRPRLRVGHRDLKRTGGTEIFAIPSMRVNYEIRENTRLELEVGGRWSTTETPTSRDERTETFASLGVRQEF
jgi:tetratricopeptide (TPR) repeat protein